MKSSMMVVVDALLGDVGDGDGESRNPAPWTVAGIVRSWLILRGLPLAAGLT